MHDDERNERIFPGSLRDWFAGMALNGMMAHHEWVHENQAAERAYEIADALLTVRNEVNQPQ